MVARVLASRTGRSGRLARVRLALIANPHSGTAPAPADLEARLRADGADVTSVSIEEIADEKDGDLEDGALAALTASGPPDRIVVAGGDGSIGPAALCAAQLGVPLAVIPVGTANDFARAKELPLDLDEACALARDPAATIAHAELGLAGERPFVNAAAAGLSVAAAQAAKPHKSRLGPLAYTLGALKRGHHRADAALRDRLRRRRALRGRRLAGRSSASPARSAVAARSAARATTTGGSTSRSSRRARAPGSCAAPTACAPGG